jgi:FolB domain-containing protein
MNIDHFDKILITDLLARGHLGVPEAERANPQDILINLTIFADVRLCGDSDCIEDTVDYSLLSKQVIELVEKSSRCTVEALATDIANLCLSVTHVEGVRVRVDKPHRVRFTRAVGVEIERSR